MSVLEKIFRAKHDYLPGTVLLPEIDIGQLKQELRAAERGAEDGVRDYPAAEATSSSETELRIRTKFKQLQQEAINRTQEAVEVYESRIRSQTGAADEARLRAMPGAAKTELASKATIEIDYLSNQRVEVRRRDKDFRDFKAEQNIRRAPRPPIARVLAVGIASFAIAVELAINAYLFQVGNELGYLGAVFEALMVPILNVTATFLIVLYGIRQIGRRETHRKILGWFSLLSWLGLVIAFNLLVAHYRDALGIMTSNEAGVFALEHFREAPLALNGLNSWAIFLIGVFVSVIVYLEAWRWDDPIPGYGDVERARRQAVEAFNEHREEALAALAVIAETHRNAMEDARIRIDSGAREVADIVQRHRHLRSDLSSYFEYLGACANECVTSYREANIKARSAPAPRHFSDAVWRAEDYEFAPLYVPEVLAPAGESLRKKFKDSLETGLFELNKSYTQAIDRIASLTEIVAEEA